MLIILFGDLCWGPPMYGNTIVWCKAAKRLSLADASEAAVTLNLKPIPTPKLHNAFLNSTTRASATTLSNSSNDNDNSRKSNNNNNKNRICTLLLRPKLRTHEADVGVVVHAEDLYPNYPWQQACICLVASANTQI